MIQLTDTVVEALKDHGGDWTGERQGDIFKSVGAFETGNDVCYIPEMMEDEGYTHQDFVDLCKGSEIGARRLFDGCTWEHPETLIDQDEDPRYLTDPEAFDLDNG